MLGPEMLKLLPTARNSNLLPVEVQGEVAVAVARRPAQARQHADAHLHEPAPAGSSPLPLFELRP